MPISMIMADCMDEMKKMPDKAFDLAIVDPEYGIGVNHNIGRRKGDQPSQYKKVDWDSAPPDQAYFHELFRVSKEQIVWGANHFISLMPFDSSCWILWDKGFSEDVSFAQFEMAWTSFDSTCKKFDQSSADPSRIHPTQKPVALYKWLLTRYAKPGWKILDTHGGSGSIAIACHDLGYDLMWIEKDTDYYEAACARYKTHAAQLHLIEPAAVEVKPLELFDSR